MTSKDPSRHPKKKKSVHQKKSGTPVTVSELVTGLRHQMDSRWPNLSRRLASVIRVSREKLDDIYCSAAQFITEHKEAFDDRRAEEKAHERAAGSTTPQPGAVVHPVRVSSNPAIKETATRSVRPPSVKKPKKSQQNSLLET
jgi:hypothetical protein